MRMRAFKLICSKIHYSYTVAKIMRKMWSVRKVNPFPKTPKRLSMD